MSEPRKEHELVAEAVEHLRRLPPTPALEAAIRHLEAVPRVPAVLQRWQGLRLAARELATGEHEHACEADAAVARRLGVSASTVKVWRWRAGVFGEGAPPTSGPSES